MRNFPLSDSIILGEIRALLDRVSGLETEYASVSTRLDRLVADVEQIKRRLDLTDTA